MVEKLADVWGWRDLPVLIVIAKYADAGKLVAPGQIAREAELSEDDVQHAIRALSRAGYLNKGQYKGSGDAYLVSGITGQAYVVTGLHRDREQATADFLELLAQAVDREPDPVKKSKLRAMLDAAGDVGGQVLAGVLSSVISRMTLG